MNFVSCIILSRQTGSNPAAAMDFNIVALSKLFYVSCRSPDNDRPVDIVSNAIGERFGAFACVYVSSDNTCVRAQRVLSAVRAAERELRVPERRRVRAAVPGLGARAPVRERALQVRVCSLEARLRSCFVHCWQLIPDAFGTACRCVGGWSGINCHEFDECMPSSPCPHRRAPVLLASRLRLLLPLLTMRLAYTLGPLPEQSPPYASCSKVNNVFTLEILSNLIAQ